MKHKLLLLAVALVAVAAFGMRHQLSTVHTHQGRLIVNEKDIDTVDFVQGFNATQGWGGAVPWFYGPWHPGAFPGAKAKFYRPLSSVFYYAQWRAFGINGMAQFMAVLLGLHLIVAGLLFLFLSDLLGMRMAAVSVGLWSLNAADWFGLPAPHHALNKWIDQPEMLVAIPYIASLWCLLRYCRNGRTGWLAGSLAAFFVGILTKEMIYSLPFAAALLLWHQGKLQERWRVLGFYFGITAIMFAFRYWALGGMGWRYGNNDSWFMRWTMNCIGGSPAAVAWKGDTLPLATLCGLLVPVAAYYRRLWLAALSSAAAVGFYVIADRAAVGFEDSILLRLIMPELWVSVGMLAIIAGMFYRAAVTRNSSQWFGWLFLAVTYLPLMSFAVTAHAWYLPSVGWAIFMAFALRDGMAIAAPWRIVTPQKKCQKPAPPATAAPGM